MRQSTSRLKDLGRMNSVRSDSSLGSKGFKFRPKAGKCNAIVQTDKHFFKLFLKSKMMQFIRENKPRNRNKYVQTEEEVTAEEEERQRELLASYGHRMYSSGKCGKGVFRMICHR